VQSLSLCGAAAASAAGFSRKARRPKRPPLHSSLPNAQ
jgi:hypothetical protein